MKFNLWKRGWDGFIEMVPKRVQQNLTVPTCLIVL